MLLHVRGVIHADEGGSFRISAKLALGQNYSFLRKLLRFLKKVPDGAFTLLSA